LLPGLPEEEAYLALFHGPRRVAADCDGQTPRRERAPLGSRPDQAALKRWLRRWTKVRHREAAERTLLTAIAEGLSPAALADALLAAETERAFADDGHSLDFINKAFECLDLIGWGMRPPCCRPSSARWWRPGAPKNRPNGDSLSILSRSVTKWRANCLQCLRQAAARVAGRIMRRLLGSCLATTRSGSLKRSRRRLDTAPRPLILAGRSPTGRRSGWRASATPTSTPTGRRRTAFSPTPTRSARCSRG